MATVHDPGRFAFDGCDPVDQVLNVVLLDDSEFDLRRMTRVLDELSLPVRITECQTIQDFKRALDANVFDICLIDHHLGGGASSQDALDTVRCHKTNGFTPSVLVSGTTDSKVIVDSIQSGFANFVDKDALSAARLSKVVGDALEEAGQGDLTDRTRQRLLSRILIEIAETYAGNTRPHLAEIYRKVDFIRRCIAQRQLPDPKALDDIEDRCFKIWRFLDDYPNHGFGSAGPLH